MNFEGLTLFNNRREVSSYTGLWPREHSSGGKRRGGSVSKSGNPRVRAMLVEMVWRMIRWQPGYKPLIKWAPVLGDPTRSSAVRKKAIVAVARQLTLDLSALDGVALDALLSTPASPWTQLSWQT